MRGSSATWQAVASQCCRLEQHQEDAGKRSLEYRLLDLVSKMTSWRPSQTTRTGDIDCHPCA